MKAAKQLETYGGLLSMVAAKAQALAIAIEEHDERLPMLCQQFRCALDVIQAQHSEIQRTLTAIDGAQ